MNADTVENARAKRLQSCLLQTKKTPFRRRMLQVWGSEIPLNHRPTLPPWHQAKLQRGGQLPQVPRPTTSTTTIHNSRHEMLSPQVVSTC